MSKKYKADKHGAYRVMVWDGTYIDGKKHKKEIRSTKSSADLEKKVAEFKKQVENHTSATVNGTTFLEYSRVWLKNYKPNARQNTIAMYDNIIEKHFSKLEGVLLCDITRLHLVNLLTPVSASLGNKIYLTFKQVIKSAIIDHYLPQIALEEIFTGISSPKPVSKEKRALYDDEKKAILNTKLTGLKKLYLWLAYGCGLRREEILALTPSDFTKDGISISKVLTYNGITPNIENTTKSKNGRRVVPVPDFAKKYINEEIKTVDGYIFKTKTGGLFTQTAYRRLWEGIQADISATIGHKTEITSHYLRHNYCTMLLRQIPTVSIKEVAYLLGDSEQVVISVYNHLTENTEGRKEAINKALNFF